MNIYVYISFVVLILYAVLIYYYRYHWNALPPFKINPSQKVAPALSISVIIPARNESATILSCIQSVLQQNYPAHLWELIVVDDYSTDDTAALVQSVQHPHLKLISLAAENNTAVNSYKKLAIRTGIAQAKGAYIVTTDADCLVTPHWLNTIACYQQQTNAVFIAGPVKMKGPATLLGLLQSLDFTILQAITGASAHAHFHHMCNGANLAYSKEAFNTVKGFEEIDTIASGDDMLLMHKMAIAYPGKYGYIKSQEAMVATATEKTWSLFFQQRIRWASKAAKYNDPRFFPVLLLVYLCNLMIMAGFIYGFFQSAFFWNALLLVLLKTMVEYRFVKSAAHFFDMSYMMRYFLALQPFHILYTVIAGLLGQKGKYEWKDRKVH